jgi:hypothetical protein
MFCTKCGFELADGSVFCSQCGNKVGDSETKTVSTAEVKTKNEDLPEFLKQIFTKSENDNRIYYLSNLDESVIEPFINKTSFNIGLETPVLFFDKSKNQDRTKGVLFTDKGIYHNTGIVKETIQYADIKEYEYYKGMKRLDTKHYHKDKQGAMFAVPPELSQPFMKLMAYFLDKVERVPQEAVNDEVMRCPNCGSANVTHGKRGFGLKNAAVGALLTGGVGLLAGAIGKNKIQLTCLQCGSSWMAGE